MAMRQQKELDEDAVRAKQGVSPESVPDLLALVGDTADGIPGLPGFGDKGAAALLSTYVHLEAIPPDPAAWTVRPRGAEKLAATLREHRDDALLYRRLATLVTHAPLPGSDSLEDVAWKGVPRERYLVWCDAMGLTTLRSRPKRWTPDSR